MKSSSLTRLRTLPEFGLAAAGFLTATLARTAGAGIILQESPDLKTWTGVAGAVSPFTVPLPTGGGKKFYRLAKP